jgi:hypothetical protein
MAEGRRFKVPKLIAAFTIKLTVHAVSTVKVFQVQAAIASTQAADTACVSSIANRLVSCS